MKCANCAYWKRAHHGNLAFSFGECIGMDIDIEVTCGNIVKKETEEDFFCASFVKK